MLYDTSSIKGFRLFFNGNRIKSGLLRAARLNGIMNSLFYDPNQYRKGEVTEMKLGIVGLPNVGKSTLFNAITQAGAEAANYPFCTIEPNVGVVTVPDERVTNLHNIFHSKRTI